MDTNNLPVEQDSSNEEISFAEVFFHYFSYWKWFVLSIVFCLLVAFIYLRYTPKEYLVQTKVLIKDNQKGKMDMNAFSDLGLISAVNDFDNELEILDSQTLMKQVSDSLNLGVSYFKEGRIRDVELYKHSPVFVRISDQTKTGVFTIDKAADGAYLLSSSDEKFSKTIRLNETISSPWGTLSFKANPFGDQHFPLRVTVNHPQALPIVSMETLNKMTTVINISMQTPMPEKGIDILDMLVHLYNKRAIEEKKYVSLQSIEFIDDRLSIISGDLKEAENKVESFRISNQLTDIKLEAGQYLTTQGQYDQKISEMTIQSSILHDLKTFLMDTANTSAIVPTNIGLTDPTIIRLIDTYNSELLEKNRRTIGMTSDNAIVKDYDDRIVSLRENLMKGVAILEGSLRTTLTELNKKNNEYERRAMNLSTKERQFLDLSRQKDIKDVLVTYLLQKREETGLSLALATPNAVVIDAADYFTDPVKPHTKIVLLLALIIGIVIPVGVIYVLDLFDNKVRNKEQLTQVVKAPFLGYTFQSESDNPFPVLKVRSGIAEKFRVIASNLGFIAAGNSNVIMVTSSYSGEGKSFFSRNLAMSLATLGKKVLLIDLDMRKSQMNKLLSLKQEKGIAWFLSDPRVTLEEVIDKGAYHKNMDMIPTKMFPPNPAELIASERLDLLFQSVAGKYDYVIVDTAPIGLVADAFRVNQFTDATIFLIRANYTFKSTLKEIQQLYQEKKLCNLTAVLNGLPIVQRNAYGYSSCYGHHNYYNDDVE